MYYWTQEIFLQAQLADKKPILATSIQYIPILPYNITLSEPFTSSAVHLQTVWVLGLTFQVYAEMLSSSATLL